MLPSTRKLQLPKGVLTSLFPSLMIKLPTNFDFSFSGLKAALAREVKKIKIDEQTKNDIKDIKEQQKQIISWIRMPWYKKIFKKF